MAHHGRLVKTLGTSRQAEQLVSDLYTFASQGRASWGAVTALLRTIGYEST